MASRKLDARDRSGRLPRDTFRSNQCLICSFNSTTVSEILPVVLVNISIAKSVPESRAESADIPNKVRANDPSLEPLLNINEAARIIGRSHWTLDETSGMERSDAFG